MIDPEEFAVAQSSSFASFNNANPTLLTIGIIIALLSSIWIWTQRHKLDVLMLGKHKAIGLGINYVVQLGLYLYAADQSIPKEARKL